MKKALQITIAGILFTIEEDAYQKLDGYLQSVQKYFGSFEDSAEIIKDIEARIAEQLLESIKTTHSIVTIESVDKLVETMGKVEDFAEDQNSPSHASAEPHAAESEKMSPKRLYRNPDDTVIAGVASGVGTYLNIDPLIVRIAFLILIPLTSGAMILIYIIAALIIPKAETSAEKINMKGGPIDLKSFRESVDHGIERVKANSSDLVGKNSKSRRIINSLFRACGASIRFFLKFILILVGAALAVGSVVAAAAITFAFINLTVNIHSPYVEFPVAEVVSGPLYYLLVALGYILIFVPLVFIASAGVSLIRRKRMLGSQSAIALGALWLAAFFIAGTLSVRVIPETREKVLALPQYQSISKSENLTDFTKLELHGVDNVTLTQAKDFSITERGREIDLERIQFEVKDHTLVLTQKSRAHLCFFCLGRDRVAIAIRMPIVQSITTGGVMTLVSTSTIISDSLHLTASDASRVELAIQVKNLTLSQHDVARTTLRGTADSVTFDGHDASRLTAQDLQTKKYSIELTDVARATIHAQESITITARDASRLTYYGSPVITKDLSDAARVQSAASSSVEQSNDYTDGTDKPLPPLAPIPTL
jgi:phage shock protein PspC (stress-responsive transcriptional regulator)